MRSEVVLVIIVHHVVLSSNNFGSSFSLVLVLGHEWSFHLKVHIFIWNKLQVVVREHLTIGGRGGTNCVSESGGLSSVGCVSSLNISSFFGLKSFLVSNKLGCCSFVLSERSVRLVILNKG